MINDPVIKQATGTQECIDIIHELIKQKNVWELSQNFAAETRAHLAPPGGHKQ